MSLFLFFVFFLLPFVDELVSERVSRPALHDIRLGFFVGERDGRHLSLRIACFVLRMRWPVVVVVVVGCAMSDRVSCRVHTIPIMSTQLGNKNTKTTGLT